jgi:hypothetical protein
MNLYGILSKRIKELESNKNRVTLNYELKPYSQALSYGTEDQKNVRIIEAF